MPVQLLVRQILHHITVQLNWYSDSYVVYISEDSDVGVAESDWLRGRLVEGGLTKSDIGIATQYQRLGN